MSWYRRYRPTTVAGLHLTTVRETLQGMMKKGRFPHALLFAGPKGTGKTSAARIVSALLNDPANATVVDQNFLPSNEAKGKTLSYQEPDEKNDIVQRIHKGSSFVVQEMDAASNRGIDDIRQLKERVYIPPQEGKVSVYILDEVHMLTTEAFNALLKMLEEPPAHVVFILATTEVHKVPDTIVSRCTLVQFYKASEAELSAALTNILEAEKIEFEPAAVEEVVSLADGSFRDGVKLLETYAAGKKTFGLADIPVAAARVSTQQIWQFLHAVIQKNEQEIVKFFAELRQTGKVPAKFYRQLISVLHTELIQGLTNATPAPELTSKVSHYLLSQFQTAVMQPEAMPFLGLELKALELVLKSKEKENGGGKSVSVTPMTSASPTSKGVQNVAPVAVPPKAQEILTENFPQTITSVSAVPSPGAADTVPQAGSIPVAHVEFTTEMAASSSVDGTDVINRWEEFLQQVKLRNSSIAAVLRSAKPLAGEMGKAKIEVYYEFHREQLQQPKFRAMLEECMQQLFGGVVTFEFILATTARAGAQLSTVSAQVNEEDQLIKLAKEILV